MSSFLPARKVFDVENGPPLFRFLMRQDLEERDQGLEGPINRRGIAAETSPAQLPARSVASVLCALLDRKSPRATDDSLSGNELNLQNGPAFIYVLNWGTSDKQIVLQDLVPNAREIRAATACGVACV